MGRDGFTEPQKRWIRRRDGNVCQHCGNESDRTLHVHHITPFRYSINVLNHSIKRTNSPFNGISLCDRCHTGSEQSSVHPDQARALAEYQIFKAERELAKRENREIRPRFIHHKGAFTRLYAERDRLCSEGKAYWNRAFDEKFAKLALKNTMQHILEQGESDPPPWFDLEVPKEIRLHELISLREAHELGYPNTNTLYRAIKRGVLDAEKARGRWYTKTEWIDKAGYRRKG